LLVFFKGKCRYFHWQTQ